MNTIMLARFSRRILPITLFLHLACWQCLGAPFARQFRYTQPDGSIIRLWGQGDEFSAVFEALDGYTVVFVPGIRAYCYARVSADGTVLESTGAVVGRDDPGVLGLRQHQRINPQAARLAAYARYQAYDKAMKLSTRWSELKARNLGSRPVPKRPPTFTTTGIKCGLTVLIDFEDEPATISREEVCAMLNADNYAGFGNAGSVKEYFSEVSNGRLTFTKVVTPYITIPNSLHPRSYYNDPTRDCGIQGQAMIRDALNLMKSLPNFTTDFLPLFQAVSTNSQNKAVSANFYVAGGDSGVWGFGIWAHSWSLSSYIGQQALWPGGKIVDAYQLSPMYEQLEIRTFCHENGHMLCGFPDLYDYGSDSWGGGGIFCLMDWPTSALRPVQFCAYLKAAAGWATVVDLPAGTNFVASLSASGPNFNHFLRLRKPGTATEYFLLENRQKTGRDVEIPASGIAVWHIDELGNRDNQSLQTNSSHLNYEVTLEQADNRWGFELLGKQDDPWDLFYVGNPAPGYANAFSDVTSPSAQWWNGARSGLVLSDFSTNAQTMSFTVKVEPVVVPFDPVDLTVFETQPAAFSFSLRTVISPTIQWYKDGVPLTASPNVAGLDTTQLTIAATALSDAGNYLAVISHAAGTATTRVARLTVKTGPPLLSINLGGQGATVLLPDGVELSSTGTGIGGTGDSCRYAYQQLSGDFDVRVHLPGINMKTAQTRAGLMIRKTASSSSPFLALLHGFTPDGMPCSVLTRLSYGEPTQERLSFIAPVFPSNEDLRGWQRIRREGNRFTCYLSKNGSDWLWLKSLELDFGSDLSVGLALASSPGVAESAYAWFREFQVLTNTPTSFAIFGLQPTAREGTLNHIQVAVCSSRNGPLQAAIHFGGTAVGGRDYLPLASTVTIPEGTNVGLLAIAPMNDALASPPKTVEVSLVEQPGLELVRPSQATALILDDEQVTGGLTRQLYQGIGGWTIADLTRQMANPDALTDMGYVTIFETPTNALEYGQVLSGYLVPPQTGDYVFHLASDENSELWLSTDSDPANARKIAAVVGYTQYRHYLGAGNHSAAISLEQGKYYYVKALHKQRWGADCFSVAWQLPNGLAPTNGASPIDGGFLAFSAPSTDGLSLNPQAASFSAARATGSVAIVASGSWSAESLDSWIMLSGDTSGTGNGQVAYQVTANTTGVLRAGTIVINGHTHSVIQEAPPNLKIGFNGGLGLAITFDTGTAVVLEACSDLQSWQPIWTNTIPGTLPLTLIDPASQTAPVRFYRTVVTTKPQ